MLNTYVSQKVELLFEHNSFCECNNIFLAKSSRIYIYIFFKPVAIIIVLYLSRTYFLDPCTVSTSVFPATLSYGGLVKGFLLVPRPSRAHGGSGWNVAAGSCGE